MLPPEAFWKRDRSYVPNETREDAQTSEGHGEAIFRGGTEEAIRRHGTGGIRPVPVLCPFRLPRARGSYAEWDDIDFEEGTYTVRPKNDVGFVPKSFEERAVPLTSELIDMPTARKTTDGSQRWVFTNETGDPEGHFLRKFKVIAKRAGLNCGQCEAEITEGKYHERKKVKVSCADRPVCEKHYLHRLRKTAATRWLRSGINLLDIQNWLGHKSLETTQIYLGYSKASSNRDKVDAAGKF